jgi:hypothetical protein
MKWSLAAIVMAALAVKAMAGDLPPGVSQRVIRIHAAYGEGLRARTVDDCFEDEDCLYRMMRAINQSGGNPGLLARGETAIGQLSEREFLYRFVPAAGERFCSAEFIKLSMAPTFFSRTPELNMEVSARAVTVKISLPENAERSWLDSFIIVYGVVPGARKTCTLSDVADRYDCKVRCDSRRF